MGPAFGIYTVQQLSALNHLKRLWLEGPGIGDSAFNRFLESHPERVMEEVKNLK